MHEKICPQCCGEQREVTLDCPSECPYLLQARQQARENDTPREVTDAERAAMFPDVEIAEQFLYEREHLIMGLSFALAKSARAGRSLDGRPLTDRDLISALTALAQSYQTLVQSSLIYEPPTNNLAHQQIAHEVATMVKEFREEGTSGRPKSHAFVDFLFAQFPESPSAIATPGAASSRIVIP